MPCGCFGKKKKALKEEEEEKYRQRDSKSREREPPTHTPIPAPASTAVPAAPAAGAPTPEGDARLRPEDDPDKANRRRDVVASFYNDQCELIGFKATGSRPPSTLVGGAHHHDGQAALQRGVPGDPSRPMASCRADLAEKRREFFKQLTIESEDGSSLPGTRPGSRTSTSQLKTRDSQHEGTAAIQMAKFSLRPVKQTGPNDGTNVPYKPPPLSEEEALGLQHRKARELMLKDIRQHAYTLRPSTQKVSFKNMLPEEEREDEPHSPMTNGDAGTTPLILDLKQGSLSETAGLKEEQNGPESVVSRSEAKVSVSVTETIAKRSDQIDPEITELLGNLSGQEISELLDDLSEPEIDLLPAETPKPQCSISLEGNVSSNQTEHNLTQNSHPSKTESKIEVQQSSEGPVSFEVSADKDALPPVSSGAFLTEVMQDFVPSVTVTEVKEESIQLTPSAPLVEEISDEVQQSYVEVAPVQLPDTTLPGAEVKEDPVQVPVIREEVIKAPAPVASEAQEELGPIPVAEIRESVVEDTQEVLTEEGKVSNHVTPHDQKPEGGVDQGSVLPPSVDPAFLRTEEEPDEFMVVQSLHQPQALPVEESAPLIPDPAVEPSLEAIIPSPEEQSLPPAPPTPPTEPEQPAPTLVTSSEEGDPAPSNLRDETPAQVPATPPSAGEKPQLAVEEPLPPPPPTPPLVDDPLPPAPPTPPMSSSPSTCSADVSAASPREDSVDGGQTQCPPERLGEERTAEQAAASS